MPYRHEESPDGLKDTGRQEFRRNKKNRGPKGPRFFPRNPARPFAGAGAGAAGQLSRSGNSLMESWSKALLRVSSMFSRIRLPAAARAIATAWFRTSWSA